jgi:hypothetical protein
MQLPTVPTREELGKFLPSQRVIRAIEQLFEWISLLGNNPFGEMFATNTTITVTVSAANTAYEIASGITGVTTNRMTFGGSHYIQADIAGTYLLNWSATLDTSTAADEVEGGFMIDGVAQSNGTSHTTVSASNKGSCIAASAICTLASAQQLSIFVRNHTAARDIVVEHVSMTALMIKT